MDAKGPRMDAEFFAIVAPGFLQAPANCAEAGPGPWIAGWGRMALRLASFHICCLAHHRPPCRMDLKLAK